MFMKIMIMFFLDGEAHILFTCSAGPSGRVLRASDGADPAAGSRGGRLLRQVQEEVKRQPDIRPSGVEACIRLSRDHSNLIHYVFSVKLQMMPYIRAFSPN